MGEGCLPPLLAIVTDAGSASKEQGNFIIKDAASTSMGFWGSPFRCIVACVRACVCAASCWCQRLSLPTAPPQRCPDTFAAAASCLLLHVLPAHRAVQDKAYLGVLEASGPQLANWVRGTAFTAMMASLFPPCSEQQGPLTAQAIQASEAAAVQECRAAFEAVQRFEASHNLALQHMGPAFVQHRGALVGAILEKGGALGLRDEVVHDAVLLLDRTGSTGVQVAQDVLPVVAAAALHICTQQGGSGGWSDAPAPSTAALADAFGVQAQAVLDMAWQLQQVLGNDTLAISAMRCLKVYLERMGCR
jgi:pentatricopeptide repeat domain-containing protein 1